MVTLINETIETVHNVSEDLRPGILDDFGLSAAIEWQAEEFQKRTGDGMQDQPSALMNLI
jgi:signal transduction histidine kinase